jgi:hypothetical protein
MVAVSNLQPRLLPKQFQICLLHQGLVIDHSMPLRCWYPSFRFNWLLVDPLLISDSSKNKAFSLLKLMLYQRSERKNDAVH